MNILFINAYFYPENISFTHLENDIINELINRGHTIYVLCPTPSRNISKEEYIRYKSIRYEELYDGKLIIKRFKLSKERRNPISRALRYLWCNIKEYFIGKKIKNIDAIFAVSTPPTQGLVAGKIAKKLKVPFIYSLQDLFPESLENTKIAKKKTLLWKIGDRIAKKIYKLASEIIVLSEGIKENLVQKGVLENKISIISNWINIEEVNEISKEQNILYDDLKISRDKKNVLYAGNFGVSQGVSVIINAAEYLKNENKIQFVLFGGGSEYDKIQSFIKEKELSNILLFPLLPQSRISEVYSLADIALITSLKGVGKSGVPSKLWSIMACNKPIIAAFDEDSELAKIVNESNAGIVIQPEDSKLLSETILRLLDESVLRNNREYVENYASKQVCVEKYIELIEKNGGK